MLQFRASEVGDIMASPDKNILPQGAMTHLEKMVRRITLGWSQNLDTFEMQKGKEVEDDAIALFNEVSGNFYVKNTDRKTTELFTGECDIDDPDSSFIWDIKNAYSKDTFKSYIDIKTNKKYFWQLVQYAAMWGRDNAGLCYTLLDTPPHLIKASDPIDWHEVSHIDPKYRVTTASMQVTQELKEQLINRATLAQNKLKEMLDDKGFEYE